MDSSEPSAPRHFDIERERKPPSPGLGTVQFIPSFYYHLLVLFTVSSLILSLIVEYFSYQDEHTACFVPGSVRGVLILGLPCFQVLYTIALRNISSRVDAFHHSVFGLFSNIIYLVYSIYRISTEWDCSTAFGKTEKLIHVMMSLTWSLAWLYFAASSFYAKYLKQNPLELLLYLRCVCIPPLAKKCLMVSPFFLCSSIIFIATYNSRHESCSLPLTVYSMIGSMIIFLMGLCACAILSFGRHNVILDSDKLDHCERNSTTMDTSSDSNTDANLILSEERQSNSFYSLKCLFYFTAFWNIIAFMWACVGLYWHCILSEVRCVDSVQQVAIATESCLFLLFFADVFVSYVFKIESCFPSILDSKPFHSPFIGKGIQIFRQKFKQATKAVSDVKYTSQRFKKYDPLSSLEP